MKTEESIMQTKQGFEESFKEQILYNRQTRDDEHIDKIISGLHIRENSRILDLGTGSGYLAFAIAEKYKDCRIIGLDIVEETLENNRKRAAAEQLTNLTFVSYDGIEFPFPEESFDYITTRYALHHFPDIGKSFSEIARVLNKQGTFFLSDPTPNPEDSTRFVDDFMKMKKDGHIKYYTKSEYELLAQGAGMKLYDAFDTDICFPRLAETAIGFDEIIQRHSPRIVEGYQVKVTEDNSYIYITQNVLNLLFKKC